MGRAIVERSACDQIYVVLSVFVQYFLRLLFCIDGYDALQIGTCMSLASCSFSLAD